jgi:hypothetical protein
MMRRTSRTKATERGVILRNQEVRCVDPRGGGRGPKREEERCVGGGKGDDMA